MFGYFLTEHKHWVLRFYQPHIGDNSSRNYQYLFSFQSRRIVVLLVTVFYYVLDVLLHHGFHEELEISKKQVQQTGRVSCLASDPFSPYIVLHYRQQVCYGASTVSSHLWIPSLVLSWMVSDISQCNTESDTRC